MIFAVLLGIYALGFALTYCLSVYYEQDTSSFFCSPDDELLTALFLVFWPCTLIVIGLIKAFLLVVDPACCFAKRHTVDRLANRIRYYRDRQLCEFCHENYVVSKNYDGFSICDLCVKKSAVNLE